MTPIPALTLHQPWATLVMAGAKRVENRTWAPVQLTAPVPTPLWVAIHAGVRVDRDALLEVGHAHPALQPLLSGQLPRGVILGIVRVERASWLADVRDPWATGPRCWMIDRVLRLEEPIPARGRQGLWHAPDDPRLRALWRRAVELTP